jgi:peptidoglycan/xylan/chitin deacetylase (PgdA/CDA1 family)
MRLLLAELRGLRLRLSSHRVGAAFVYHRIGDPPGDPARELVPALGADRFGRQVRYLRRRYELVTASDLGPAIRSRRRGERIPIAVTFDDDLTEHVSTVLPLLQGLDVPATFFLCGASLDGPSSFWWERLDAVAREGTLAEALPASLAVEHPEANIHETALRIQRLPREERELVAERLGQSLGPLFRANGLRRNDVQRLAAGGFEIGFHTLRHDELPPLDDDNLQASLTDGSEPLQGIAGRPLTAIAYPHGEADERVARLARAGGYDAGFTTDEQAISPRTDPMLMGRIAPSFGSMADFAWSLVRALAAAARVRPTRDGVR